jgi:hypothetical protein
VHDAAERVDRFAVQQHVHADQLARFVAERFVVERGVAPRARLQLVEEVEDDLGERELVVDLGSLGREVAHVDQLSTTRLAQLEDRAEVLGRGDDGGEDHRLLDVVVGAGLWHLARVVDDDRLVAADHVELDVRRRRDQLEIELALETLLHDVHMEQAEEPAPEPEPERQRGLRLEREGRVVQFQPVECLTQLRVVAALGRIEPAPDHRQRFAVPREGIDRPLLARERDRVAHLHLMHVLQPGDEIADLAGFELRHRRGLRREHAGLFRLRFQAGRHEPHLRARGQHAVERADVRDDPAVGVEARVEDQGSEGRVAVSGRWRDLRDDAVEQLGHALAGLPAHCEHVLGLAADQRGELAPRLLDVGIRQVDLVDRRHDREPRVPGQVEVRECLRLDPLRGVDEEHRALARRQRA